LAGGPDPDSVLPAAAAAELMQAALLVHDDIMDHDPVRRGGLSVHEQFVEKGRRERIIRPDRFGDGMGICTGDIAFFLTFELLSELMAPAERIRELVSLWARELSRVALAQMQDMYLGGGGGPLSERDILDLYKSKTARYSFSLPLMTGAHLAGAGSECIERLEECGETLGLLFQLRDDDLGLFGSQEKLGKPVGSDIRENKKTLHYLYLFECVEDSDRKRLRRLFGAADLSPDDVRGILDLLESSGARRRVMDRMEGLSRDARRMIEGLGGDPEARGVLVGLLGYITTRTR